MDFLKTLLAYVALTVAFSVQEGPLPQDVPTPTPLPPNVTASPIPNAPAATDVPTATPTASPIPEPTITPNMGYRTVQWQDRGSGVLKVQKKLIELGYLAEGEDDGAYGSKTTAASRRRTGCPWTALRVRRRRRACLKTRTLCLTPRRPCRRRRPRPPRRKRPRRAPRQRHLRRMICLCRAHPAISRWIR